MKPSSSPPVPTPLNPALTSMGAYASKSISQAARANPDVVNLSIGEPEFGPPEHLIHAIAEEDLSIDALLASVKHYNHTQGTLALRQAISHWYQRQYGLTIDPEQEILITHGGVEAFALAVLCCSSPGDALAVTDPSYMLYERAITALGRHSMCFSRPVANKEFAALLEQPTFHQASACSALVVNSPENPSGYVLSAQEWQQLVTQAQQNGQWIIHDEVYDSMSFGRKHYSARAFDPAGEHTVLINSFSKKFGTPGLRIGWMIGPPKLIQTASKAHDYLVLGVNQQYERIALRMLSDPEIDHWLAKHQRMLENRVQQAMAQLTEAVGFSWPRHPMGGMFLFPSVRALYARLPSARQSRFATVGEAVADYLLHERGVATVPGIVYGQDCADHLRMVLCCETSRFQLGIERLTGNVPVMEKELL
ncbi:pyridoxal phosphate-dependent aminotransferase [Spartinivicinus poritis]|uniref:Pyridoxal phosphate-dependent aminotransferase n=1 Tax=Spartinivicinus poritis TaxID=2994640 RepID=A0ABT5U8W7_9GAMM|nr:pyridoxal phosphate-dependent aminotransferase [Spartinivicinus sp. A2-2]MDE1462451.1 pyridoxal phosphate-dependent aminotransferase [Spartinivicinus sp. A2-2]